MNPEPQNPAPQTDTPHSTLRTLHSEPPTPHSPRRRTGKIAGLPKSSRNKLNQMLEDGLPYATIIKKLGIDGKGLTENNLSDWHHGGFQDWLNERLWLDDMRARHELARSLIRENADCKLHEATLIIAATVVSDLLRNFDPDSLRHTLKDDPLAFIRLLNALSRLSRQGIKCERQRDEDAERKASNERWQDTLKGAGILP